MKAKRTTTSPPVRAAWDSGRRESRLWHREFEELKERQRKQHRSGTRLVRRYGTHWPTGPLNRFMERGRSLETDHDRIVLDEEGRFDPWFPPQLIEAIDDALNVEAVSGLVEDLWQATTLLAQSREDDRFGVSVLTSEHVRRLKRIENACDRLIHSCGLSQAEITETQKLIGGWAHGLLNGFTLKDIIKGTHQLSMEVGSRLFDRRSARHRKTDTVMARFYVDVAMALAAWGEPIKVHRESAFARVLAILLESLGEKVPRDMMRRMSAAAKACAARIAKRDRVAREWAIFDRQPHRRA